MESRVFGAQETLKSQLFRPTLTRCSNGLAIRLGLLVARLRIYERRVLDQRKTIAWKKLSDFEPGSH